MDKDGYDIRIRDGGLNVLNQDSEVVLNGLIENDFYELGRLYKQTLYVLYVMETMKLVSSWLKERKRYHSYTEQDLDNADEDIDGYEDYIL